MPLKHATETVLVFILGLATVLAGVALGILPSLSLSIVPWLVLFGLTLVYPLVLYPLLRSRRADYPFRLLHFVPALMVLLWLAFDVLSSYVLSAQPLREIYTWGWTFLAVVAAFFLIVWFCLSVIRQRVTRIGLLALILVPFAALAFTAERRQWPDTMANAVWPRLGIGSQVAQLPSASGSLALASSVSSASSSSSSVSSLSTSSVQVMIMVSSSSSADAGTWTFDTSSSAFSSVSSETFIAGVPVSSAQALSSAPASSASSVSRASWYQSIFGADESSESSVSSAASSQSSAVIVATKPPPKLSSSGPGEIAGLGLMFAAAYCGVLHRRVLKRKA